MSQRDIVLPPLEEVDAVSREFRFLRRIGIARVVGLEPPPEIGQQRDIHLSNSV